MRQRLPLRLLAPLSLFALLPAACGGADAPPPAAPVAPAPTVAPPPAPPVAALPSVDQTALDTSVAPCDDFYAHACGGWMKATPIPEDKAVWARSFSVLAEENAKKLRTILEDAAAGKLDADNPYSKSIGDMYASCTDEAGIEARGLTGLKDELARVEKVNDAASLAREIAHQHLLGGSPVFAFGSETDQRDATKVISVVQQDGLTLPDRDYYVHDDAKSAEMRQKMLAHVEAIFVLAGDSAAKAKTAAATVLKLETQLATPQMPRVDERDPDKIYHRLDRKGLAAIAPGFAWDVYFKELGYPQLDGINVAQPEYAKAFSGFVKSVPMSSWRTYLRWRILSAAAPSLAKAFVDEDFHFQQALTGAKVNEPRWRRCVRTADKLMGEALGRTFAKTALGADGKAAVSGMVDELLASMGEDVAHLAWMDEPTRAKAKGKIATFAKKIGYPGTWRNYDALHVDRHDYLGNVFRAEAFEAKRDLEKVGKPVDRSEWGMTPPTINAQYNPSFNDITFPAGILQSPFFTLSQPRAMNFGGIGMVMGHEITHGFDDEGRKFDADGSRRDWWTEASGTEFEKRATCVANQYDTYAPFEDKHVNGRLTLGENIADLGGLKIALAALHRDAAEHPSTETYAYTPDQLFFYGFAQSWCTNIRDERLRTLLTVDPHSPARFRVDGTLSNLPEFAAAFSCSAGAKMVNANRCEVW